MFFLFFIIIIVIFFGCGSWGINTSAVTSCSGAPARVGWQICENDGLGGAQYEEMQ